MHKKFLLHQTTWWIIVIIHAMAGSCKSCKKRNTIKTPPVTMPALPPPSPTIPTDETKNQLHSSTESFYSESSASSGISSGSSLSSSSSGSSSSGFSSGSSLSSGSSGSSPDSGSSGSSVESDPTPFAGLPSIGNTCYMNAVLQVIAAMYKDEVRHPGLKKLTDKINTGSKPLSCEDINQFIDSLPNNTIIYVTDRMSNMKKPKEVPNGAKEMANSGLQHDPDEFIKRLSIKENCGSFLYPIVSTSRVLCKIKRKNAGEAQKTGELSYNKYIPTEHDNALPISFKKKESSDKFDLSEMIALNMEEFVDDYRRITPGDYQLFPMGPMSDLLAKDQGRLEPMQEDSYEVKNYITQTVINHMPSKLYVQLKRFLNDGSKKLDLVHGTMEITIHPDPNLEYTVKYDLNAFIVHRGNPASGHYAACVKRKDTEGKETWYKADEASITKISTSTAIAESKNAYLLFYTKR